MIKLYGLHTLMQINSMAYIYIYIYGSEKYKSRLDWCVRRTGRSMVM